MYIIYILLAILILPWIYGLFVANDFSVPTGDVSTYKKILVIYPHPDDETLASGGLIRNLTDQGSDVTIIILTKGERGNEGAHLDNALKKKREEEFAGAAKALGATHVVIEDFGDGKLSSKKIQITKYLKNLVQTSRPDLIITYDLSGMYGHEDHIVVSEILTDLVKKYYSDITLLYSSLPKKTLQLLTLPEHMAKDPEFSKRRVIPTMKVFIGFKVIHRVKAIYAYKSQLYSFSKGMPIPAIPPWYYYSMQVFEYYHKAN